MLLLGTAMEPAKQLGSEVDAKVWLDTVVTVYAQRSGIALSAGGSGGSGSGGAQGATINSEEFLKFQAEQEFAAQHVELYMQYLKHDSRSGSITFNREKANSAELQTKLELDSIAKEHGDTYIEGIQPVFDPLKACRFDSSWNWVRQDALVVYYDLVV